MEKVRNIKLEDLTLRNAKMDDLPMIFSHMERIWGPELVKERLKSFDWLFVKTPYMKGELSPIFIFTDENSVYGVAFFVPVDILLMGDNFRIVWGGTVSLEKELRGKKVGNMIATRIRDRDMWSTGYPIEATLPMYQSAIKEGHPLHVPGKFGTLVKPLRVDNFIPVSFMRPIGNAVFRSIDKSMAYMKSRKGRKSYRVERVSRFGDEFDRWFDSVKGGYRDLIIMKTDSAYLNWRYLDAPVGEYSAYILRNDEGVKGYFVLNKYISRGVPVYCIDDFLFRRKDNESFARILAEAASIARNDGAFMLKVQENYNPEFRNMFRKFGFLAGKSTRYPIMFHVPEKYPAEACLNPATYFFGRGFADPKII